MDNNLRWIAIAFVMGLCAAYAMWGQGHSSTPIRNETIHADPAPQVQQPNNSVIPTPITTPGFNNPTIPVSALRFNPPSVDFGEVFVNQTCSRTVDVENTGDQTINITNVKGTCGCLKADMPTMSIAPGKSEKCNIFITGVAGRRTLSVTVTTSENVQTMPILSVLVQVKQIFSVEPQTISFGTLRKNDSKTMQASIKREDGSPFSIIDIVAKNKEFTFKYDKLDVLNGYKITVTATAGSRIGFITEGAAILTDHPKVPAVPLNLCVNVQGDVLFLPNIIATVQHADKSVATLETIARRLTPGPLIIESVSEVDKRPVGYTVQKIDESSCKLSIYFTSEFNSVTGFGEVAIKTNAEVDSSRVQYIVSQPNKKKP